MTRPQTPQAYWDSVHRRYEPASGRERLDEHWLAAAQAAAGLRLAGRVLEIGCGLGYDTGYLLRSGCRVTALDFSLPGLLKAAAAFPAVDFLRHRLPDPLPLRSASFDAALAGLSLHYFPWQDSERIVAEIARVLRPGGLLCFRVNAVGDSNFGFGRGAQIEPNFFDLGNRSKRFFSEADCRRLFEAPGWQLLALFPMTEQRYSRPKQTWAGIMVNC